jgi:hypothetical protein
MPGMLRNRTCEFGLKDAGKKDLRLKDVRLKHVWLKDVGLKGVRLKGVRLKGVRLKGARLKGARLKGARLKGARLNCREKLKDIKSQIRLLSKMCLVLWNWTFERKLECFHYWRKRCILA